MYLKKYPKILAKVGLTNLTDLSIDLDSFLLSL